MQYGAAVWIDDVEDVRLIGEGIAMRLATGDRTLNLRISHHVSRKINEAVRRELDSADRNCRVIPIGH